MIGSSVSDPGCSVSESLSPSAHLQTNSLSANNNDSRLLGPPKRRKRHVDVVPDNDIDALYKQYNICRAFQPAVYRKHINSMLILRRATSGVIVMRPHISSVRKDANNPVVVSQMFSNLESHGNQGKVTPFCGSSPLYLQRCIPSQSVLHSGQQITEEVKTRKGPGRPYGSVAAKRKHSLLVTNRSKRSQALKKARGSSESLSSDSLEILEEPSTLMDAGNFDFPIDRDENNIASAVNVFDINSLLKHHSCVC